jgi:hypothetical protein
LTDPEQNVHIAASLSYIFFGRVVSHIQKQLDNVVRDWRDNVYFVIGLQIRSAFTDNSAFDKFASCAKQLAEVIMKNKFIDLKLG